MDTNATPTTPAAIAALTEEEQIQLRKDVTKTLAKNILRKVAVTATVAVAAHFAMKHFENKGVDQAAITIDAPTEI